MLLHPSYIDSHTLQALLNGRDEGSQASLITLFRRAAYDERFRAALTALVQSSGYYAHFMCAGAAYGAPDTISRVPGASKVLHGGQCSHAYPMTDRILGYKPSSYASPETGAALAVVGFFRAEEYAALEKKLDRPILSIGCTSALQTDRTRKGEDRVDLALRKNGQLYVAHVVLSKQQTRDQQIDFSNYLALNMALWGAGIEQIALEEDMSSAEFVSGRPGILQPRLLEISDPGTEFVHLDRGGMVSEFDPKGKILYPGSFNPLHFGHIKAARAGERASKKDIVFEISTKRVNKDEVERAEALRRANLLRGTGAVIVGSNARLFVEKLDRYGINTFLVGTDTAIRVVDPSVYPERTMHSVLGHMRDHGVVFWVMQRQLNEGSFSGQAPLTAEYIPLEYRSMFRDIPGTFDISSTELRNLQPQPASS